MIERCRDPRENVRLPWRAVSILIAALIVTSCGTAGGRETGFIDRTAVLKGKSYPYVVYVPRNWTPDQRWPVILFLHGSGERGTDGMRQTSTAIGRAIRTTPALIPAIVVFPQAPPDERWIGDPVEAAMLALDRTMAEYRGDPDRVYLTGLSLGGYGAWHLALMHPRRFAALVVIAGGIVPAGSGPNVRQSPLTTHADDPHAHVARTLRHIPIWMVHGTADTVILPSESRRMAAALEREGAEVHYRELEGVGHDSWERGYVDPDLWKWLFEKRRAQR